MSKQIDCKKCKTSYMLCDCKWGVMIGSSQGVHSQDCPSWHSMSPNYLGRLRQPYGYESRDGSCPTCAYIAKTEYDKGYVVNVLNKGYIKLVDLMGSDQEICRAARVSYHEGSTKKVSDDAGLIDHLMRFQHTSPFEMATLKFEVKLPIFVERQWVRHRTCQMNEMSGRYSEMPEEYYIPRPEVVRAQSETNKQGRDGELGEQAVSSFILGGQQDDTTSFIHYKQDLDNDIARELARIHLPLGTYTKKVWQMNLHNLFHFLKLRTDSHAQWEIQQYANEIEKFVARHFPLSHASWKNHVKDARTFSVDEWQVINDFLNTTLNSGSPTQSDYNGYNCLITRIDYGTLSKTRKRELKLKLGLK